MKLLYSLLILTIILIVKSDALDSYYYNFTLSGDGCSEDIIPVINIGQCIKLCGNYTTVTFNPSNEKPYQYTVYKSNNCFSENILGFDQFTCNETAVVAEGSRIISCQYLNKVEKYISFKPSCDQSVSMDIDTCTYAPGCGDASWKISKNETNDISYVVSYYSSTHSCSNTPYQLGNIYCLDKDQDSELFGNDYSFICSTTSSPSSSSTVTYSLLLLISIILLNLLF